jgi:signal transduction histidine kinase
LTRGALAEMRTLLLELRPAGIAEKPLGVILRQLADAVSSRTRLPISITVEGDECLSSEVQTALYRIAQEALNNVAKHAHATRVSIRLDCTSCEVMLEICDDGQGFDTTKRVPGKHGMGIMYERASSINALLEIKSAPGGGTCISIRRQVPEEEQR